MYIKKFFFFIKSTILSIYYSLTQNASKREHQYNFKLHLYTCNKILIIRIIY